MVMESVRIPTAQGVRVPMANGGIFNLSEISGYLLKSLLAKFTALPAGLCKLGVVTKVRILFQKIMALSLDHFTMLSRPNIEIFP